ncbi:Ig-like domain-containing protein [Mixta tenebrionis]|uniref:Ig-like domain-containing protein n=1 Tax=Mixta tenebrionis TaxID=2562439 RepID=A0A506VC78_9GAMM|nr:Ig-like domain-containing protein [Mixta tenebrionis]TPW42840.1 Ig-like domain-containing protein [Mixta tenebrionis]
MAQLSSGRVDIISRENGTLLSQNSSTASRTVLLSEPSVVRINGTRSAVASFERQGDDLILHMQDGSIVRYQRFFLDQDGEHSELVFDDGVNPPEHALFPVTSDAADATTAMAVTPAYESLGDIEPLLLADNALIGENLTTAVGVAGVLGLAGIGIASAGGGGGGGGDDNNNGGGNNGGGDNGGGNNGGGDNGGGDNGGGDNGGGDNGGGDNGGGNNGGGDNGGGTPEPALGSITITEPVSGDGYLSASEAQSPLIISGTTTGVSAGSTVTLTFNGVNYTGIVGSNGSWTITIPASALGGLGNGTQNISVTVVDGTGDTVSDSGQLNVLVTPPQPTLNPPFGDGTLDGNEAGSDQTLTGNTGATGPGQSVTVTIGGNDYTGSVGNDGSWSVTIPGDDLQNLPQGENPITVTVTDPAGNSGSSSSNVIVDTVPAPATGTVDMPVSGDNMLSGAELQQDLLISGTGTAGDRVTVNFDGVDYSGVVQANGRWVVTIPASALGDLASGDYPLQVSITNAAGTTTVIGETPLAVDPSLPATTLTLDPIAGDNILNAAEQDRPLTLSGSGSAGDTVSVTLNNINYQTTVGEDGRWSLSVPASDLATLTDGDYALSATATSPAGGVYTQQTVLTVDTAPPALTLDTPLAGDGYLNNAEAGAPLAVSGTGEAGATVTVSLNGTDYTTSVAENGQWAVSIPAADLSALPNGNYTLTVSASDANGNTATSNSPLAVVADPAALPAITLDPFTGDNQLDNAEQAIDQLITGTTSNVSAGQTVIVTLNGVDYTGTVQAGGSWSVTVPAADLAALADGNQTLNVTVSDVAGNSASGSGSFTVAPPNSGGAIAIAPIAVDGYLNAQEAQQPLTVSGSATQVAAGSTVTVSVNGNSYTGTVAADGSWSVTIPVADLAALNDGPLTVTASVPDGNGNTLSDDATLNVAITPLPAPVLDTPFGDGVLSGSELTGEQTLTGSTGVSGGGQEVVVSLNGNDYPATVDNDGNWTVTVPVGDIQDLPPGDNPITVTVTDVAGNTNSATTPVTVDVSAPTLTVNPPSGDGVINAAEQANPLVVSGTVDAGSSVTVNFDGVDYPATVAADGSWSVSLPAGALQALEDGRYDLTVTATRPDGASATTLTPVAIDTSAPLFTINPPAGDGILNAAEQGEPLTISGSGSAGDSVIVTLNGVNYATSVGSDGQWAISVPAGDLGALSDGNSYPVNVLVTDASGNRSSDRVSLQVDTTPPALTIDAPSEDGLLNAAEQQQTLTLTGSGEAGGVITITLNGETFTGTVGVNGQWRVEVPPATLATLNEGPNTITVSERDAVGNVTTGETTLTVDAAAANQPTISVAVDIFAGNGVLDSAEQQVAQLLTGSTSNVEAGQRVTVTLNGASYTGLVDADGNWSVTLPAEALNALNDGSQTLTVTVNDAAGNSASASADFTVNTALSGIALAPVAGDGYLNAAEAAQDLVINGTSVNVPEGRTVVVTFDGQNYTATVTANGSWSVTIPAANLTGLQDGPLIIVASTNDATGSSVSSDATLNVAVNAQPTVTIDPPFDDGYLNAAEQGQDGVLTGNTGISGAGQTVTVTLEGNTYTGTVAADGSWSVTLPATALGALNDGDTPLAVTVSDVAGNSASGSVTLTVDTSAPPVTLATPVSGGVLNAAEAAQPLELNGSGEAGNTITVTLNGNDYATTVGNDGLWTLVVPAADVGALADGSYTLSVTASDAAGNTTTVDTPLAVKADAASLPQLTINDFAGNNVLDGAEQQTAQLLTGSATNVEAGQIVTITLGGQTYEAVVQSGGAWSVSVPASALGALANGGATISATVSDAAGNSVTQTLDVTVNNALSGLSVDPLSDDGYLNASEAAEDLLVTGSSANLTAGTQVTVTLNDRTYSATVGEDGSWSVTVPASALAGLADGTATLTVSATDAAGNPVSSSSDLNVIVNNLPDATLQTPFSDGILNAAESGAAQQLLGNTGVTGAGQSVTVSLNGVDYSGTVDANGNWRVTLPTEALQALPAGENALLVTASDAAGNTSTVESSVTVDTTPPTLSVDAIAGDNRVNAAEAAAPIAISGSTDAGEGQTVTVSLNGQSWTTQVDASGNWTLELPAGALAGINSGDYPFSVTVSDAAGNPASSSGTLSVQNALLAPTINTPFGDGYLNLSEAESAQTLSGVSGVTGAGQTVIVSVDGVDYPAEVDNNGNWTLTLDAETLQDLAAGVLPIVVTVTDAAGNVGTVENAVTVDYSAPSLTLDPIAGDDILNQAETRQDLVISGSADGADVGQRVTVSLGGQTLQTVVLNDGSWRVTVPASVLQGLNDGETTVSVTLTDAAGNPTTIDRPLTVAANPTDLPQLTLDTISGDGYINQAEAGQPLILTGSSSNLAAGDTVTVTLNGASYSGQVDETGNWSVTVPQSAVGELGDGVQSIVVSAADAAGNPASAAGSVTVVAGAASQPTITLNPVTGDDIVNAQEAGDGLTITGGSQRLPEGSSVTVTLNGQEYATTVDANGNWSVTVPPAAAQALPQGDNLVTVSGSDLAGNPAQDSETVTVDTAPPALAAIELGAGADNILNLAEALAGITVRGESEPGQLVTVTLNGRAYTGTADGAGNFAVAIPGGDLQQLADGTLPVTVSVTDANGNVNSDTLDLTVAINTLPALTLDTPFSDGVIGAADAAVEQTLSGSATNLAAGTEVRVTIGSLNFTTTVDADGNWRLAVPAETLNALADGTATIVVSAADAAGNPASAQGSVDLLIATQPEAALDTPFIDGVLNAAEAGAGQVISGTTGISGVGQTVSVVIDGVNNGEPLTANVSANGSWSLALTPQQLAALADGTHSITVTVVDRAGNSDSASLDFTSITTLPTVTLETPFDDGRLNAVEAASGATLNGTTGVSGDQTVVVSINGGSYPATVDAQGNWTLTLTPEQLQTLPDGTLPVTVTVTDAAGNSDSESVPVQVIVNNLPEATINLPFGNGALSAAEADVTQTLSGQTGVSGAGQRVSVVISGFNNDEPLNATVDAQGNWTLNLTPAQLETLGNGTHTITVTASDAVGNTSVTAPLEVITAVTLPQPAIDTPFGDGVLNISEAAGTLTLSGNTGASGDNQGVQLRIDVNGTLYSGTVDANGDWTVNLPAGALSGLSDGTHNIVITVVDSAGNVVQSSETFTSAQTPPAPTVNLPFGDGLLNAADAAAGATLSGNAGGASSITVTLGGQNYPATVNADGSWTLDLPAATLNGLAQGNGSFTVTATDANGNSSSVSSEFTVNTSVPVITIGDFAGDNALSYAESIVAQTLSGSAAGAEPGSLVSVTLGGATFNGIVDASGGWSVNVPPETLAGLSAPSADISVTITDPAGNSASASATIGVNLTPPAGPLLTLATVAGDNILNASEGLPTFSGTFANFDASGGTITLLVNGTPVAALPVTGESGSWTFTPEAGTFPADGSYTITASASASGAAGATSVGSTLVVDRTAPTLTINAFSGDGYLNGSEASSSQTISGTASASEAGRTVTITLGDNSYRAIVQADGSWRATVPAADLQALEDGNVPITATLSDAAGNVGSADSNVIVDTSAPLLQVDALLGNNILNAADILLNQVLTGRASGAEGQTIGIYLGDGSPIATAVVAQDGTFSIDLTPEVLGSLTEGPLVLGVRVSDEAGNVTDATLTVNKVVNGALNLIVDSVFGDGFLNAADTAIGQTISGIAESAGIGATVSLTLGGTTLTAAVGQDGKWAIVVPPSVLGLLQDGDIDLNLTLTDAAGNQRSVTETVTAIVDNLPVIGNLTGLFGGDNLLNIAELGQAQTIGGAIDAATGSIVTVTLGNQSYQTQVTAGGRWGVTIPATDLGNLLDGTLALGVQVTDPAGNTASQSVNIGVFGTAPAISLNPIFGNGFLNAAELLVNQTISGVAQNVAAGSTVNISIGNSNVTATVGANGVFTATVTPDILGTLTQGNLTVGASVTDAAGNTASASGGLVVDVTLPTINLNPLFGDGLLNAADALVTQVISGTIGNVEPGARVSVAIGGQTLVTTADANGAFSVALPPTLLQGLADGNLTASVTVTDAAGNSSTVASLPALVGIHNLPVITLDPLFGDGVLNLVESLVTQTITGTVANAAAGSQVRVNIGNVVVNATVGGDGRFSAAITPDILGTLLNGNLTVGVSVTDPVGNVSSVSTGLQIGIANPPALTVNTIFGDGVLSAADLNSAQIISGGSSNLGSGSSVTVTLNGRSYTTTVGSSGSWSLSVPRADLAAISDGTQTVSVRATDAYGNVATANGNVSVIAHTPPTLTISSVFGDGLLNATDALTTQTINGTSTNAEGSTVVVRLGGNNYTGTVGANGAWSVAVPPAGLAAIADGSQTVSVSVTNSAGVAGSTSGTVQVGTHTLPTVTLNSFFGGDGYLNLSEANVTETISGTATNAAGRTVTVNVAGTQYTTTVGSNGSWSVNVPSATLRNISDGSHSINVSVSDAVGNSASASGSFNAITHNLPVIGVDPVLSLVSVLLTGLTISGGTLNLRQGTVVNVTLNGVTQQATVDALGRYSVKFSGGLLTALNLNSIVTVTAADAAGNRATTSTTLLLGSLLPVATSSEAAALALMAVSVDEALASDRPQDHSAVASGAAEQTAAQQPAGGTAAPDSTLTTGADIQASAATAADAAGSSETTASGAAAETAADDIGAFTIGGLTIVLADGTQQQGEAVTGSAGNDTVIVNDLGFTHIDGGAGTDTLLLNGEHMQLDLTALGLKVEHIEVLNLGQSGTNSVKLDLDEALKITDAPQDDLLIKGADGSLVTLANSAGGVWSSVGQREVDGQLYDIYHNSALAANDTLGDVLVQHNLQVQVV